MRLIKLLVFTFCVSIFLPFPLLAQNQDTAFNKPFDTSSTFDEQAKFLEAVKFVLQGDDSSAVQILASILMANPDNHAAAYELSKIYYRQGNFFAAAKLMEDAVKQNSDNYWYWKQLLDSYQHTGNDEIYLEYFSSFIKRFPDKPEDYGKYLDVLVKNKKYDDAINFIDNLIAKNILDDDLVIKKFELLLKKNKKKEAIQFLNDYLKKYPCSEPISLALSNYYFQNNNDKDAVKILNNLLQCDTSNEIASLTLAEYYQKKGENEIAFQYLLKAFKNPQISVNNKVQYILNFYPLDNLKIEDTSKVLRLVSIISEVHNQEPEAKILAGNVFFVSQQYENAAKEFEAAINLKVNAYDIYEKLLICYASIGNYDQLKLLADKVIELYPFQPLPYYFSGYVSFSQKQYEESRELLEKSLKYSGRNTTLVQLLYRLLAEVNSSLKDYEKSDFYYEIALKADSTDATLLNNYSYSLAERKKDLDKALQMSKQALEFSPNEPSYLDTYGWILYQMGKYEEAIVYLKKAVELSKDSNDSVLWEHLGDAYYKSGNLEEALKNWKIAMEKGDTNEKLFQKIQDKKINE